MLNRYDKIIFRIALGSVGVIKTFASVVKHG